MLHVWLHDAFFAAIDPTSVPGEDNLQLEFVSPHQYILVNHDR